MTEWCTAHPWMTFFIAVAACSATVNIARAVFGRKTDCKYKK